MRTSIYALSIVGAVGCGSGAPGDDDANLASASLNAEPVAEAEFGAASCGTEGLALQVLDSGGPFARDERA